jgi:hypothetical protein
MGQADFESDRLLGDLTRENSPAADAVLIYDVEKVQNPDADELAIARSAFFCYAQKELATKGILQPKTRAEFMHIAYVFMVEYRKQWQRDADQMRRMLMDYPGWNPDEVIPELPAMAPLDFGKDTAAK